MNIVVVPDQPCPGCGAYWGHPDPTLDFPNRPKVDDAWKCYNPNCEVAYYRDGEVLELKLSPEEAARMEAEAAEWVASVTFGKAWVEVEPNVYQLLPPTD